MISAKSRTISASLTPTEIILKSDFKLKDAIKGLKGSRWDKSLKKWCLPATPNAANVLLDVFPELLDDLRILAKGDLSTLSPSPDLKVKLWAHQLDAYIYSYYRPATMLAMEMRTGKTLVSIALAEAWQCQRVLVMCPLSVVGVWAAEVKRFSKLPWHIERLHKGGTKDKVKKLTEGISFLSKHRTPPPHIVIINHESVWREPFRKLALTTPWDLAICDESHRGKAPGGKFSFFLRALANVVPRRLALTGTPMPHSPFDIYSQFRFLDRSIYGNSFSHFKTRYAEMGGFGDYEVKNWRHMDEFSRKFHQITVEVKAKDAFDLPDEINTTRSAILEPSARKTYQSMEKLFWAEVKTGEITASNALVKLLHLQQITSGVILLPKEFALGDSALSEMQDDDDRQAEESTHEKAVNLPPVLRRETEASTEILSGVQDRIGDVPPTETQQETEGGRESVVSGVLPRKRAENPDTMHGEGMPENDPGSGVVRSPLPKDKNQKSETVETGAGRASRTGQGGEGGGLAVDLRVSDDEVSGASRGGTPDRDGRNVGSSTAKIRVGASQKRSQGGQPEKQSGAMDEATAGGTESAGIDQVGHRELSKRSKGRVTQVISQAKRKLLRELLEDFPTDEKLVIFARFSADLEIVHDVCIDLDRTCGEISGQQKDLTEGGEFPPELDTLAVQIQSGSLGINLSLASTAIFYSWGWSLGDVEQARARIRHGEKKEKLHYIHLTIEDTLDERMLLCLENRKDFIEDVIEMGRGS
jgi:hypothetical protein